MLQDLIDPLPPQPVSWMPQTLGWKVLFIIVMVGIAIWSYRIWVEFNRDRYRRDALRQIRQLTLDHQALNMPDILLRKLNIIAKTTAMQAYPTQDIAALYGEDWLEQLNRTCHEVDFNQPLFGEWQRSLYSPDCVGWDTNSLHQLVSAVQLWVSSHKKEAQ
nr:DUF4381 domain-containing protein [Vibrio agarivorans]